jgi:hypothetical protein
MPTIEVLDPKETEQALSGHRFGSSAVLSQIAQSLVSVLDSEGSVYVEGLNESNINALRTKMARGKIKIVFRKVERDGKVGHILMSVSMPS